MRRFLVNGFEKYAPDGTLDRWGACSEDDAWLSVGTSVRGDRHGLARKIRHDPDLPQLNQGGRRANTNAGMRNVNWRGCDREMVMSVAYESVRGRCMAISLTRLGDATPKVSDQLPLSQTPPVQGHACERVRFAGRHQRRDEQRTRNAMDHRFHPDEGPGCQSFRHRLRMPYRISKD